MTLLANSPGTITAPAANRCERDKATCFCEGADNARCLQLKPIYETAPLTCKKYQDSHSQCTGAGRGPFCQWVKTEAEHVCRMHMCWVKFMNTLVSCPGLWPNMSAIQPNGQWKASAATCSEDCAPHMRSFHEDKLCTRWLERAVFCDSNMRNFVPSCSAKTAMRAEFEAFLDSCQVTLTTDSFTILQLGVFASAGLGCWVVLVCWYSNRRVRKGHKADKEEAAIYNDTNRVVQNPMVAPARGIGGDDNAADT